MLVLLNIKRVHYIYSNHKFQEVSVSDENRRKCADLRRSCRLNENSRHSSCRNGLSYNVCYCHNMVTSCEPHRLSPMFQEVIKQCLEQHLVEEG